MSCTPILPQVDFADVSESLSVIAGAFVVGPNRFSAAGVSVQLDGHDALSCEVSGDVAAAWPGKRNQQGKGGCGSVIGELIHSSIQPVQPSLLAPDVMGWLAYLPGFALPCRHGVVSLGHDVAGTIAVDAGPISDILGHGYLEKDWGTVFPKRWLWLQCNTFRRSRGASLLLSIAELPLPAPQLPLTSFEGLLALLWVPSPTVGTNPGGGDGDDGGQLWRFTTYTGARVDSLSFDKAAGTTQIVLRSATHSLTVSAHRAEPRENTKRSPP